MLAAAPLCPRRDQVGSSFARRGAPGVAAQVQHGFQTGAGGLALRIFRLGHGLLDCARQGETQHRVLLVAQHFVDARGEGVEIFLNYRPDG